MKVLAVLLVVAMVGCVKAADMEKIMKIMKDCKESSGASEADMGSLMAHALPQNQEQKCLISCILKSEKIIENGKISEAGLIEVTKKLTNGDAEKMKSVGAIIAACKDVTGDDECDTGAKIGFCLKTEGEKNKVMYGM